MAPTLGRAPTRILRAASIFRTRRIYRLGLASTTGIPPAQQTHGVGRCFAIVVLVCLSFFLDITRSTFSFWRQRLGGVIIAKDKEPQLGCVMDLPRYCLCSFEAPRKFDQKFASCLFPCTVAQIVDGLCAFAITLSLVLYPLGLGYINRSALNLDHIFLNKSLTLLKYLS